MMLYEPGVGDGFKKSEARQIVVCEEPRQVCDSIQRKKTTEPGGGILREFNQVPTVLATAPLYRPRSAIVGI